MKWTRINRADGRVELCCKHGVGHPVKQLTRRWDAGWMGVHGCDGCCSTPSFAEEVERRIEQAMAVMTVARRLHSRKKWRDASNRRWL